MRNVFIVGPSCSGKTSLLHHLKQSVPECSFPIRIVSRPPRTKDDELENEFLSHEEFRARRHTPDFFVTWERVLGKERTEYYGFRLKDVSFEKINIFSANNAFLLYPDTRTPRDVFETHRSSLVACIAPDEVRAVRLKERSPEYGEEEVSIRIHQESIDALLEKADLVLDSTQGTVEENAAQMKAFLAGLKI